MQFRDKIINNDTLHKSDNSLICDIATKLDLISDFDIINRFKEVSIKHLQQERLANRGR